MDIDCIIRNKKLLIDSHLVYYVVIDMEGNYVFANRHFKEMYSKAGSSITGTRAMSIVVEEDRLVAEELAKRCQHTPGVPQSVVIRKTSGCNTQMWTAWDCTLHLDEKGNPFAYEGIGVDISEERKAKGEMVASRHLYEQVVNTQKEMITRFLPDTTLLFVNEAYCRYFNQPGEALVGKRWIDTVDPSMSAELLARLKEVEIQRAPMTYTTFTVKDDGTEVWLEWTDYPFFDEKGKLIQYQSVGYDITLRKRAEIKVLEQNKKLKEIARIQSHQVRKPVATIMGLLPLFDASKMDTETRQLLELLDKTVNELDTIINSVVEKTA